MNLQERLRGVRNVFIDTAPLIYFIEAHEIYGPQVKDIFHAMQIGKLSGCSSVVTLLEVLPRPIQESDEKLAQRFVSHLRNARNFKLYDITMSIAEQAGRLRGTYPYLKSMDALQLAAAIEHNADVFLTNDKKLKQFEKIPIVIVSDHC